MLSHSHVTPFLRRNGAAVHVTYLADTDGRVLELLDRLCRLVRRLEGRPRTIVVEALRRQERRVRDVARLSGIAKTLLDRCSFVPPVDASMAPAVRAAVFHSRGRHWPPVPGDH